jgi:hypothetical protein
MEAAETQEPTVDDRLGREEGTTGIVSLYSAFINARPALISLLYDIDMLPEQTVTRVGARRLAAFCEVWKRGEEGSLPGVPARELDVDGLAQEIRRVDGNHTLGAGALAEALVPYIDRAFGRDGGDGAARPLEADMTSDYVIGAMGVPG